MKTPKFGVLPLSSLKKNVATNFQFLQHCYQSWRTGSNSCAGSFTSSESLNKRHNTHAHARAYAHAERTMNRRVQRPQECREHLRAIAQHTRTLEPRLGVLPRGQIAGHQRHQQQGKRSVFRGADIGIVGVYLLGSIQSRSRVVPRQQQRAARPQRRFLRRFRTNRSHFFQFWEFALHHYKNEA